MTDTEHTPGPCQHKRRDTGYDHHACKDCGWVMPDSGHSRKHGLPDGEWYPSMKAFDSYVKTGVKLWDLKSSGPDVAAERDRLKVENAFLLGVLGQLNEAFDTPGVVNTNWGFNFTSAALAKAKGECE